MKYKFHASSASAFSLQEAERAVLEYPDEYSLKKKVQAPKRVAVRPAVLDGRLIGVEFV